MKKIIFILLVAGLVACKKDNEVIPDQIELSMTTILKSKGKEAVIDSTMLVFREISDTSIRVIAYTNAEGKATVYLKKNTEYSFSANSRTFDGPHYYYYKSVWLRSSWESDKGENYYQKGWPVVFYSDNWVDGAGATSTDIPDPTL